MSNKANNFDDEVRAFCNYNLITYGNGWRSATNNQV